MSDSYWQALQRAADDAARISEEFRTAAYDRDEKGCEAAMNLMAKSFGRVIETITQLRGEGRRN